MYALTLNPGDFMQTVGDEYYDAEEHIPRNHQIISLLVASAPQLIDLRLDLWESNVTADRLMTLLNGIPLLQHLSLSFDYQNKAPKSSCLASIAAACSQLRSLTLRRIDLGVLVIELWGLTALTRLELEDTGVISLPSSISKLSALRNLNLRNNHILESLPSEIGNLANLTLLDLERNETYTVRTYLSYGGEEEETAPDISLPESISRLTQLRSLNLKGCTSLELPSELWNLYGLQRLKFDGSCTTMLTDSISRLTALEELDASNAELPLGLLACQKLTSLHTSSCAGSPVLTTLRALSIFVMPAEGVVIDSCLQKLTDLTSFTMSSMGPEACKYLKVLAPSAETSFPSLTGLRKLVTLCIEHCLIDDMPSGPHLNHLKSLTFRNCEFEDDFPINLVEDAPQLSHVSVVGCKGHNYDQEDLDSYLDLR